MLLQSRWSLIAATISMLLAVTAVAFVPPSRTAVAQTSQQPIDFSLRSIDGQKIGSDDVRGQVVVLAIGATWLPLSRKQAEGVRKLANDYGKRGVVLYWVSTDSESPKSRNYATDEQLRAFGRRHQLNVTVLRDPDAQVVKQMGVDQLPAIIILDKSGRVNGPVIGGFDPEGNLSEQIGPRLDGLL